MTVYRSISSALEEPEKVTKLYLIEKEFESFPHEILKFTNLEEITFDYCKLNTISSDIVNLAHLKAFSIINSSITNIPPEVFLIPLLEQGSFAGSKSKGIKEKDALMGYISLKRPIVRIREAMVALLYNNRPAIDNFTYDQLAEILNEPIPIIHVEVKKEIEKRSETCFKENLPAKHSRIVLKGKFKSGYNMLADRIKSLGIEVSKKIKDDTNYIVMGEKPGEFSFKVNKSQMILTENQLLSFLNAQTSLFKEETGIDNMHDNLLKLLQSVDPANHTLAIEIINRNGLPEGMITELLACWIINDNKTFRDRAKKTLNAYGSPALQKLLTNSYFFRSATEEKISSYLNEFDKKTEIDGIKLAKILFDYDQIGCRYLLDKGDAETRQGVVNSMVKNDSISFSMMRLSKFPYEILNLPNLKRLSLRTGKFDFIPEELGNLQHLEVLDLGAASKLKAFPESILKLKNLKYLSLSYSFYDLPESLKTLEKLECLEIMNRNMESLPEWLTELTSLRYLSILGNPFTKEDYIPKVLFKMPFLEELVSQYSIHSDSFDTNKKAPMNFEKLQKNLPKTKFTFDDNIIRRYEFKR